MELKNKAGLALALAAIFTTGGANLAFASDNVSADNTVADGVLGSDGVMTGQVSVDDTASIVEAGALDASKLNPGNNDQIAIDNDSTIVVEVSSDTVNDVPLIINGGTVEMAGSSSSLDLTLGTSKDGTNTKAAVTGDYVLNTLVADANTVITVGLDVDGKETGTPGSLEVAAADLNGALIFADPTIVPGSGYNAPSKIDLTFKDLINPDADAPINGVLVAGQNSIFTIGDSDINLIEAAMSEIGFDKWTNEIKAGTVAYNAAMAFVGPQTIDLSKGGLTVNGWLVGEAPNPADNRFTLFNPVTDRDDHLGQINFGDNSLTVFDLTGVDGTTAALEITAGTGDIIIGSAGKDNGKAAGVYFRNAVVGEDYLIFEGADSIEIGGSTATGALTDAIDDWFGDNLYFANGLLSGTLINGGDGTLLLTDVMREKDAQEVYTKMSDGMAYLLEELIDNKATATEWVEGVTDNAAVWFISNATEGDFTRDEATAMVEGAAQIAVVGGVPYLANNIVTRVNNLIVDHNDMLNATQPAYGNEPGQLGIWATPFYGMSDVDGMGTGRLENGFELSYGGAAFGLDYNVNEAFRLGAALNVGGGSSDADNGSGDFYPTENDFDFFGASLYGSYTNGAFGLTGDLGFSGIDSEITQRTPLGSLKSDVDSNVFTLGLTGKYRFVAGENLNVAPHLGLRYTQISMDDANVKLDGPGNVQGNPFNSSVDDMGLFQIPLGIEFSTTTVTDGGWTVTPHADLGVLFTMGDTEVDTRYTADLTGVTGFPTNSYTDTINADVIDSAAFTGTLGIKAQADNGLSLGLDYGILASGNQTDHQFTGMLRFEF